MDLASKVIKLEGKNCLARVGRSVHKVSREILSPNIEISQNFK
jgi:hypothetical protein